MGWPTSLGGAEELAPVAYISIHWLKLLPLPGPSSGPLDLTWPPPPAQGAGSINHKRLLQTQAPSLMTV